MVEQLAGALAAGPAVVFLQQALDQLLVTFPSMPVRVVVGVLLVRAPPPVSPPHPGVAARCNIPAALSATPYYNQPTPEGLYQHYKTIADAINIPIMLYNIMGRTGLNIDRNTMLRPAEIDKIVRVKEASGNIPQEARNLQRRPHRCPPPPAEQATTHPTH